MSIPDPGPFSDAPSNNCECGRKVPRVCYSLGLPPSIYSIPIKISVECACGACLVYDFSNREPRIFFPGMINPSGEKVRQS